MAISDYSGFSAPVLVAIETWAATAAHQVGTRVTDAKTGKTYRFVQAQIAGTVVAGVPGGCYAGEGSGNGESDPNVVTDDASVALGRPSCVFRGTVTDAYYGWVEEVQKAMATTVNVASSDVPVQATSMRWSTDGVLTSCSVDSTTDNTSIVVAVCLDSAANNSYLNVAWL